MNEILDIAENEMKEFKHPYVGSEHFLLAYLTKYKIDDLSYEEFKSYVLSIIGTSSKESEYILYTPILRTVATLDDPVVALKKLLSNEDSIAHNILLSKGKDIEKIISTL